MRPRLRRWFKGMLKAGVVIVVAIAAAEAALAVIDPLGAHYFNEQNALFFRETARSDPRGYGVAPGQYQGRHWSFTILPDGTRAVPATHPDSERTAVFIGDSLTFSYGVDDAEAFVNLLASEFPGWRFINAGMPAFSAVNYARALAQYPDADVIFVVTIANDRTDRAAILPFKAVPPINPYVVIYWRLMTGQITVAQRSDAEKAEIAAEWEASLRTLDADPRVHILTFAGEYAALVEAVVPDVQVVKYFGGRISPVDPHADADGNRELYESMLPTVRAVLEAAE